MAETESQRTLGAAIRSRRCELGWSQKELAQRIVEHGDEAFRQSDVSRLEQGKVTLPRRERLEHVAAVLNLSLGELLARSGWAGAGSAFPIDHAQQSTRQEVLSRPGPLVTLTTMRQSPASEHAVVFENLYRLIEQAHETRARTVEVMRQCEATRALYEQPLRQFAESRRRNDRPNLDNR